MSARGHEPGHPAQFHGHLVAEGRMPRARPPRGLRGGAPARPGPARRPAVPPRRKRSLPERPRQVVHGLEVEGAHRRVLVHRSRTRSAGAAKSPGSRAIWRPPSPGMSMSRRRRRSRRCRRCRPGPGPWPGAAFLAAASVADSAGTTVPTRGSSPSRYSSSASAGSSSSTARTRKGRRSPPCPAAPSVSAALPWWSGRPAPSRSRTAVCRAVTR